jgi:DNA-binding beta-propeller fold protein YncE
MIEQPLLARGRSSRPLLSRVAALFENKRLVVLVGGALALVFIGALLVSLLALLLSGAPLVLGTGTFVLVTSDGLSDVLVLRGSDGSVVGGLLGARQQVRTPRGLLVLPDGSLLVSQATARAPAVLRVALPCSAPSVSRLVSSLFLSTSALAHPYGLAAGVQSGNLFVTNQDSNAVTRYSLPAGSLLPNSPVATNFTAPRGIAAGLSPGNVSSLFVAARDLNAVLELDEASGALRRTFTVPQPIGVLVTAAGQLLAGSSGDDIVRVWDLGSGMLLSTLQHPQLQHPAGMAMLNSTLLLVLSQTAQLVVAFDLTNPAAPFSAGVWAAALPVRPEQMAVLRC